ncbi:hypothetical protein ACFPZ0_17170 [Streptomonospora nanhaiensis]|uniref:Putative membrane protein YgcG n=1 Tax=Streptomonospora nanhaiensis TaxID=1323731 RepID=A0A853BQK8_9ACTN|nr:hypothetical protein [Streptomonospora nanhaiensis]MBX9389873.1 hypothetical protein [Streptomonospora nanhaiensis]NYI96847.1 putative membrane protein YgcG [Streptomonospora nanhaiensis]
MDTLLGIVLAVLMTGAILGIAILLDDGSPPPRRRPKHISKETWKLLEKSRKENHRRGPESGGGGWSGGDGGDGGDGGGGGD